jgi:phage terminase small subunit
MPRKSAAAALTPVANVRGTPARLRPPPDLGPAELTLWHEIVTSVDARHFVASDAPLLGRYVEAAVLAAIAGAELRKYGGVTNGRVSPWLTVQEKSVRSMVALSHRLRLAPASRQDRKTVASRARSTLPSAYEVLREDDDA